MKWESKMKKIKENNIRSTERDVSLGSRTQQATMKRNVREQREKMRALTADVLALSLT